MSAAKQQVCAHVKRGVCPKCANPMQPPRSGHRDHGETEFGRQLALAMFVKYGSARRRKRSRR